MNQDAELTPPRAQEQQILVYYASEVRKNLENLTIALSEIDGQAAFLEKVNEILDALQCIADLAMIHGYDSVEAIAEKMAGGARHHLRQGDGEVAAFKARMEQALDVLRRLVDLADDYEAQWLVQQTAQAMEGEIPGLPIKLPDEIEAEKEELALDKIVETPADDDEDSILQIQHAEPGGEYVPRDDLFDICEPQLPVSEVPAGEEFRGQAAHVPLDSLVVEHQAEEQVEEAFDAILARKVTDHLDRLATALSRISQNENRVSAVQEVRDACTALKILSEQVGQAAFNQLVFPLDRLVRECLHPEEEFPEVEAAIARAEQLLRSYIASSDKNSSSLLSMKDEVERILDAKPAVLTPEAAANLSTSLENDDGFADGEEYMSPPKPPMIIRLKRWFGMG